MARSGRAAPTVRMLPRIKPRHYSIASAMRAHPHAVHLLVVEVEWTTPGRDAARPGRAPAARRRFGQCSHYLARLAVGDEVAVSVLPSEMQLPVDPLAPVVMAGLGTGMAPFRAFVQERAALKAEGVRVGPMTLYFGARFRAKEFLYGEELLALEREGVVRLRLAFSRDQDSKCYIQHLMAQDAAPLRADLRDGGGAFYLCGPTWPEGDVEDAMSAAFADGRGDAEGRAVVKAMKAQRRYVLEVY